MMQLQGTSFIGLTRGQAHAETSSAFDPAAGQTLEPAYAHASAEEIEAAVQKAAQAFADYRQTSARDRAAFLRAIAEGIAARGDHLAQRTPRETGLPEARVRNETGRTCHQLRLFADLVEDGSWVDARIDRADPKRTPAPKPDTRSMWTAIGPVVVFGASNFPLAFSVAGGDTASALAGGNPVIVKAHGAHLGTAEIVADAVIEAVRSCKMPDGVFSLLYGAGRSLGATLVRHPLVRAVGFTGSLAGGRALMDLAAARPEPIPVYTEMSSINPVFLLPQALTHRSAAICTGLSGSLTLGVGQFCTNPGLVFALGGDSTEAFLGDLSAKLTDMAPAPMLTPGIGEAYRTGVARLAELGVDTLVAPLRHPAGPGGCHAATGLFRTSVRNFLARSELMHEVFGPSTLVCVAESASELVEAARHIEGQLTATVHAEAAEWGEWTSLLNVLTTRVGRLIANGFPTGVEVCHSMVHGGPYPATSDGRSTSVGTRAIYRFCRQICFQDLPDAVLPVELQNANPRGLWRMVDGQITRDAVG